MSDLSWWRHQIHHSPSRHRFACSRLPYETDEFTLGERQVDAVHDDRVSRRCREPHLQISDFDQRRDARWGIHADRAFTSSIPRTASPARAKAKTAIPSATPGKRDTHQSPVMMFWAPSPIIVPHSGVGGRIPAPTKLRPAVRSKAHPTLALACAIDELREFGRI